MCWDEGLGRIIWSHVGNNANTTRWGWNACYGVLALVNILSRLEDRRFRLELWWTRQRTLGSQDGASCWASAARLWRSCCSVQRSNGVVTQGASSSAVKIGPSGLGDVDNSSKMNWHALSGWLRNCRRSGWSDAVRCAATISSTIARARAACAAGVASTNASWRDAKTGATIDATATCTAATRTRGTRFVACLSEARIEGFDLIQLGLSNACWKTSRAASAALVVRRHGVESRSRPVPRRTGRLCVVKGCHRCEEEQSLIEKGLLHEVVPRGGW